MNRLVVYLGITIAVFICFDRMVVSMVDPTERLVVDSERYQNRDFSLRMKAFKARRNQTELLVLGDSRSRHGVMASELVGDDITGFNLSTHQ